MKIEFKNIITGKIEVLEFDYISLCPKCKRPNGEIEVPEVYGGTNGYSWEVVCKSIDCGYRVWGPTAQDAIDRWNNAS